MGGVVSRGAARGGGAHAVTKWMSTPIAKTIVESMARENSIMMPTPSALTAIQAEPRPFFRSFCLTVSLMHSTPVAVVYRRPHAGHISNLPAVSYVFVAFLDAEIQTIHATLTLP